jgi:cellulose biosynthesis protein BcsQ
MSENKKKTLTIAISNQKGGCGKTTSTMLLASIIHATTRYKVKVYDIDPQGSLEHKRETELKVIERKLDKKLLGGFEAFEKVGKGIYPIVGLDLVLHGSPVDVELELAKIYSDIQEDINSGEYDLIFFDFPGYLADPKYLKVLLMMNYVFVPFYLDDNTTDSTFQYINTLKRVMGNRTSVNLRDFAVFFWRYSKAKNVEANAQAEQHLRNHIKVNVLSGKVYDSIEFENNRSTILPFDLKGEKSLIPFVKEMLSFIKERELTLQVK